MITAFLLTLHFLLLYVLFAVYAERKTAAFIQNRLGPYEVGPYGLLQPLADILKLLQKQDLCPRDALRPWFYLAPVLPFVAVLSAIGCVPLFPGLPFVGGTVGVLLVVALLSLNTLAVLVAGWASGSKFSTYGAFRAVAQVIAYEVPLGFSLVAIVLITQSLDFELIALQQQHTSEKVRLLGVLPWDVSSLGGFLSWNLFTAPVLVPVGGVFFICSLAQTHRTPFDLPEAENELVAGYHTEYSGFRWSLFMMAEYGTMFLMSLLMVWLLLGAGYSPLPNLWKLQLSTWTNDSSSSWGGWFFFWTLCKTFLLVWVHMWIRWSLPRVRTDQLLRFCWCCLTPVSICLVFLAALWTFLL